MNAWLLDAYLVPGAIRTWWITTHGKRLTARLRYTSTFYVGALLRPELAVPPAMARQSPGERWRQAERWLQALSPLVRTQVTERLELLSGQLQPVLAVIVRDPFKFASIVRQFSAAFPYLQLFQADLPVVHQALYDLGLFPTAWCEIQIDSDWIRSLTVTDDRAIIDPVMPHLRFLSLKMEGEAVNPRFGKVGPLIASTWESNLLTGMPIEDRPIELILEETGPELLDTLNRLLLKHDPDVIFTDWGDDVLLPQLQALSDEHRISVQWNRDPVRPRLQFSSDHTYFSYGKIVHRAQIVSCFGRLHIDSQNSFLHHEGGLAGLVELARLSSLPLQRLARTSIGTAMSSMQLLTATRRRVLIPVHKREPEDWKTAWDLVQSDKGGLVYQPLLGFHQDVIELDFASMYPSIMVCFNISPETINCRCCSGLRTEMKGPLQPARGDAGRSGGGPLKLRRPTGGCRPGPSSADSDCPPSCLDRANNKSFVPEIGYRICHKRRGLVPETLELILHKRAEFKRRMKIELDPDQRKSYDQRQNALKWILVTCFGYLGFKNARFGRIEAHESVTAFGRELLLKAKEIGEHAGFRFLHGIVDAVWLQKNGVSNQEAQALSDRIAAETGIGMKVEGIYRWIAFLPSKEDPALPVANRYFGLFRTGAFKVRGIELRRRDTPPIVNQLQADLLVVIAPAKTIADIQRLLPQARQVLEQYCEQLGTGRVPFRDLVITKRLSRDPRSYVHQTLTAVVARELLGRGIPIGAGESVQYVMTDLQSADPQSRARSFATIDANWTYDTQAYIDLLRRAFDALFSLLT